MSTQDIGAARVHLIVDATDWETTIARAGNSAAGFGDKAEQAFDRVTGKARTSANRLLDYVATLGKVEGQFERYLRQAARAGVETPLLEAAVRQWKRYQEEVALATNRQNELNRAQEEANEINRARNAQMAANSQQKFNQEYGVEPQSRSIEYLNEQARVVRALTTQAELREQAEREVANQLARSHGEALQINAAFEAQMALNAQRSYNQEYGVEPAQRSIEYLNEQARVIRALTTQAELREQAERAVVEQISRAYDEAQKINAAFNEQRASNSQGWFNEQLGVGQGMDSNELAQQRRVVAELTAQAELREQAEQAVANQLARSHDEALQINAAFEAQMALNAQRAYNQEYGVEPAQRSIEYLNEQARVIRALTTQAELREQAERAVVEQISRAYDEAQKINAAFNEQRASNSQGWFNEQLGVGQGMNSNELSQQRRVVAELTEQFNKMDMAIDSAFAQNTDIERFRQQLENMAATAGKTHYELLQMRADQLGVGKTFAPMIAGLQKQDQAMGHAGLTAKQYAWAMRGLPAQITDITVGLMTGQTPWMVFLQQGGQLKDMFGGLAPAAKAVSSAVWAMINPWTVGAAALGAMAYAGYDAAKSMERLAIATAKGGGVGGNADDLYRLADTLNGLNNVNLGAVEAAIARLASGGKLAGDNFDLAAEATSRWVTLTGEGADDIAGRFEAIAKGPLEAIESGQVKVTEAQYRQIKALVENGDQQRAVNELVKIFYDTVNDRSASVEQHLSSITQYWIMVKDGISGATRELGGFVNGMADFAVRYEQTYQRLVKGGTNSFLAQMQAFNVDPSFAGVTSSVDTTAGAGGAAHDPEEAKREKARTEALARWNATADQAAERQNTLNKLEAEGLSLGQSRAQINAVLDRQRRQWAAQDARSAARGGGRTNDGTAALREQQRAELAALATQTKEVKVQYQERQISAEDYYGRLREIADQELVVQMRSIDAQKAAVAGRKDATQRQMQLESEAAKLREQHSQKAMDIAAEERQALFQLDVAWRQYTRAMGDSTLAMTRSIEAQVMREQMGDKEYDRAMAISELYQQQADKIRDVERQVEDRTLTSEEGERRIQAAIDDTANKLGVLQAGYATLDSASSSALNGMRRAWENFSDEVDNVAANTQAIWTYAFDGFADSATEAITGSLDEFDNYFENLHKMILNFIIKQQMQKALSGIMGDMGGGGGGGGGGLLDGALSWFSAFFKDNGSFFAKGGVPGGESLGNYRNQMVHSPIFFPFAKGGVPNVGVAGEAGTEAIMPVARTSSGDLGVRVIGGAGRGNTTVNQTYVVQGTPNRYTREQMELKTGRATTKALNRN